jgi:hypothetical protein
MNEQVRELNHQIDWYAEQIRLLRMSLVSHELFLQALKDERNKEMGA